MGYGQRVVMGHDQRVVKDHGQRVVKGHGQRVVMGRHGQRVVKGHGQRVVMGHGQRVGETSTADERDGGAVDVDEILLADARGAHLIPCNVLDLASFPPSITTSASVAATQA